MIKDSEVKKFFNRLACKWDSYTVNEKAIKYIIDKQHLDENSFVLDVGCGTGVLIPYYIYKDIAHVDAVDLSDKMIETCRNKFKSEKISFHCTSILNYDTQSRYDLIMIYNALPHLPEREKLFAHLSGLLKENGRLVIAHGLSLEKLTEVHDGVPAEVADDFPKLETLKKELSEKLTVTEIINNDNLFCLTAVKK